MVERRSGMRKGRKRRENEEEAEERQEEEVGDVPRSDGPPGQTVTRAADRVSRKLPVGFVSPVGRGGRVLTGASPTSATARDTKP